MKKTFASVAVVSAFLLCFHVYAQQEAVPVYTFGGSSIAGYANNGAGFAFSPNVSIAVTALGFNGTAITNSSYQVDLFDAVGNQLATAVINNASAFYNQTYYEGISAVNLTIGDTYYLGAFLAGSANNTWIGNVIDPGLGAGTFSVNPDISYLNAASGFVPPGTVPGTSDGANYYVGANFQFIEVPEPASYGLLILGAAILGLRRRVRFHTRATHKGVTAF